MFIRCKKRKTKTGKEKIYAYVVENKYRKNGKTPRQKVKKYLGRVYFFEKIPQKEEQTQYTREGSWQEIITQYIEKELKIRGFKENEGIFEKENVQVNIDKREVTEKNTEKAVCIAINEGIFAKETLTNVLDFKVPEATEREIGKSLGNAIVATGIAITNEKFIEVFQKIRKNIIKIIDHH